MHWIIQDNLFPERGVEEMINFLDRHRLSYSLHKVVPFIGEIEPDFDTNDNVIVYGAYSLRHIAKKKGWVPGCFDLGEITYKDFIDHWGINMLNYDIEVCQYKDVIDHLRSDIEYFIRPIHDSKHFAGMIVTKESLIDDWRRVVVLEEDDGSTLRGNTMVMISTPKFIAKEHRVWVVDGKIVTYSLYKLGQRILYRQEIDEEVKKFVQEMINIWQPQRAFVIDIATMSEACNSYKIVECNTFNAAGLYAGDSFKIIEAIEAMEF